MTERRPGRVPLRTRLSLVVTTLCAGAMAATALTWITSGDPALIVSVELGGLALIGVVSTVLVRRELRPLERAADTADAIAAGDLSRRLSQVATARTTEVGRLAEALNRMLDRIETALTARERSEARMRQFVADASHELRTPLQSLRGYAELYQQGALPDLAAVDDAMARILSEVHRMTYLVESLLMLARIDEAGGDDGDGEGSTSNSAGLEPVDLSRVAADSVRDAAAVEPARPWDLRIESDVTVPGDEDQLRSLLANLLSNVRVHTPPGAGCTVALLAAGDEVTLRVEDAGPGIPEDAVAHVFDRFYRADKGRSRSRGGTGLGLAIVAAIADVHHARVTLDSTVGRGTRVEVVFPATPHDALAHTILNTPR